MEYMPDLRNCTSAPANSIRNTHRWLLQAFAVRLESDYDVEIDLDPDGVKGLIDRAMEFIEAATALLRTEGS